MAKLLVIDDDVKVAAAITRTLQSPRSGDIYTVVHHTSVKLALAYLQSVAVSPDAILCDAATHGLPAADILAWIRENDTAWLLPRLAFMYEHDKNKVPERVRVSGLPLLRKPFNTRQLLTVLDLIT